MLNDEFQITDSKNDTIKALDPLTIFGIDLKQRVQKQCLDRQQIEKRWVEDMRHYHGQYSDSVMEAMPKNGSKVFINLTKPKVAKGEAQLVDMLFPPDEKNWGISPTPNPDLSEAAKSEEQVYDQNGNALQFADDKTPVTEGDVAKSAIEIAEDACKKMEREIDDQLKECEHGEACRKIIHYAAMLGTGVICAPEVEMREERSWAKAQDGTFVMAFKSDKRPIARHVQTWDFFPDLSATEIQECNFIFERTYMSARTLKKLKRTRGIIANKIDDLLKETEGDGKSTQNFSEHVSQLRQMAGIIAMTEDKRYEVWRYRGAISIDVLVSAGVFTEEQAKEMPQSLDGIVIFCGDKILKAAINPLESEDWPYSVFCWNKDDHCIFGTGIARDVYEMQSIINTSARLMLDNSTRAASPQVIIGSKIKPLDGSHEITPWKMWQITDPTVTPDSQFKVFTFPSLQTEIANIYNLAKALLDEVSGLPAITQGEQGQVTQTVGGMSLLMNAATTTLRNRVKHWDDAVTIPLIKRFYDWNMQYNADQSIKGDMNVFARGVSALLAREEQAQALFMILNNYVGHPVLGKFFTHEGLDAFRKAIQTLRINPDELIKSVEKYVAELKEQQDAQQQQQQEDPRVTAAKITAASREKDLQGQLQIHQMTNDANMKMANTSMQAELIKMASAEKVSLEKIYADYKKATQTLDLNKSKFISELQLKLQDGESANYGLD